MNILLLSPPDSFEHMPNGALTSLVSDLDAHHKIAIADLILCQRIASVGAAAHPSLR